MKKKLIKYRSALAIVLMLYVVSSCLKDDRFNDLTKVAPAAEFLGTQAGKATAVTLSDPNSGNDTLYVTVNVTGTNAPTQDVTLNLGFSQTPIDIYNQDQAHVVGQALPTDAYSYPSSVTIKAGKDEYGNNNRSASFKVVLNNAKVPQVLGQNNVLAIQITSAPTGYIVSGSTGYILFNFYHNIYDGPYHSKGTRWNFNQAADYTGWDAANKQPNAASLALLASASPWDFPATQVVTVNAQNSLVHEGNSDGGFGLMNIRVNADNTVLISSTCPANDGSCAAPLTAVANLVPLPGTTSTYNPATGTFELFYQYTNPSGTFRVLHDVLVHN
jgi:hypothetical protein